MIKILSLGGSIVAPDAPDHDFIARFVATARAWLDRGSDRRLAVIVGGGGIARDYQKAFRELAPSSGLSGEAAADAQDWIGVMATRLNAQLVKAAFGEDCRDPVVTNPSEKIAFTGRVLLGAGWKPGFSTDFDAVLIARQFGGDTVVNLSNIAQVYTADPKLDPNAKPIDRISWPEFRAIVGDEWTPGKNAPFDPVASREAEKSGIKVVCAAGRDLACIEAILDGKPFKGTIIG